MKLHTLPTIVKKPTRRLGRGHGTGRGKTAGRGTKGQKARESVRVGYEGGQLPLIKRLPLLRGRSKHRPISEKYVPVNLSQLSALPAGTEVTEKSLIESRILSSKSLKVAHVKILGDGDVSVALTIKTAISKKAAEKITAAGGSISQK